MKTNLEKLIELYTTYEPIVEMGTNTLGEYGRNFHMLHHWHTLRENNYELLNKIVNFDIETETGIYLIEDYYIGASQYGKSTKSDGIYNGIRNRIIGHLSEMFYYYWNKYYNEPDDVRYNYLKTNKMWQSFIENDTINVTQLSDNPSDEDDLINEYLDKGYDLQNPYQVRKRKLLSGKPLSEMEISCLREHRNWEINNIWFKNSEYVKLSKVKLDDNKISLYRKYANNMITTKQFLRICDSYIIKYRIYDENFTEFDKNFRLSYEEISNEQIKQYDNKYGTRFGIK